MLKKISNIGDCGITCDFGDEVNKKTNKEVIKLFNFIQESVNSKKIKGILNYTPSYNKLIINFELGVINSKKITEFIKNNDYSKMTFQEKNMRLHLKNSELCKSYEIMKNPTSVPDAAGEWIEITNISEASINLYGLILRDDDGEHHVISNELIVLPNEYIVLGNNNNTQEQSLESQNNLDSRNNNNTQAQSQIKKSLGNFRK